MEALGATDILVSLWQRVWRLVLIVLIQLVLIRGQDDFYLFKPVQMLLIGDSAGFIESLWRVLTREVEQA